MTITNLQFMFEASASPIKADEMRIYMKEKFEFYGINSEKRKALFKTYVTQINCNNVSKKWQLACLLWEQKQREYHYCAIDLLKSIHPNEFLVEDITKINFYLTTNTWWDSIDILASHVFANYYRAFPIEGRKAVEKWRRDDSIWLQRTCLIFQLFFKEKTDTNLLVDLVNQLNCSNEFFIKKAIGWSLRQYAKTDEHFVTNYISHSEIKGLALKEATKHINHGIN